MNKLLKLSKKMTDEVNLNERERERERERSEPLTQYAFSEWKTFSL